MGKHKHIARADGVSRAAAPKLTAAAHDGAPAPAVAAQLGAAARGHSFGAISVAPAPAGAIQPRLTVGGAHDRYEDEADRVAGQVMRMPDAQVQRVTLEEDEDTIRSKPDLQRRAEGSFAAGAPVEGRIAARRGGGSPLPEATRAFMEPRFGADFSCVRVHADAEADRLSHHLSARAFTTGRDIYFRHGAYSPRSASGQELLAHELTHVVQQGQGKTHLSTAGESVVQRTTTIDVERQQKLVKDADGGKLTGKPFTWRSKFDVDIKDGKVVVTIRINSTVPLEQFENVWKKQVTEQWSNRFMLKVKEQTYPIVVNLVLEPDANRAHYPIKAVDSKLTRDPKSRGHFGTESMTTWGIHDSFNIAHEVGHMLGNIDEYGEVEVPGEGGYVANYIQEPSDTIMAISVNNPVERHYYLIKWAAEKELGINIGSSEVAPYMQGRLGVTSATPKLSQTEVRGALSNLKQTGTQKEKQSAPAFPVRGQSQPQPGKSGERPLLVPSGRPLLVPKQASTGIPTQQAAPLPVKQPLPGTGASPSVTSGLSARQGQRPLPVPKQVSTGVTTQQAAPLPVKQPPASKTTGDVRTGVKPQPLVAAAEKKPLEGKTISTEAEVKARSPAPAARNKGQASELISELQARQHARRVHEITTFVMKNVNTLTQEQQEGLKRLNWNDLPADSEAAIKLLNL